MHVFKRLSLFAASSLVFFVMVYLAMKRSCGADPSASTESTIRGILLFDGKPIPNVTVRMRAMSFDGSFRDATAMTDLRGRFDLGQVDAEEVVLFANTRLLHVAQRLDLVTQRGKRERVLALRQCPMTRGRIVDDEGRPIADVPVLQVYEAKVHTSEFQITKSGPDGGFEACGSPNLAIGGGRWELLDVSSDPDVGDIVLRPSLRISGVVHDGTGKPVEGALVYAYTRPRSLPHATGIASSTRRASTRRDGSWELTVAPGCHRILVSEETQPVEICGSPDEQLAVPALSVRSGTGIRRRMHSARHPRVTGIVTWHGSPVAGAQVWFTTELPEVERDLLWPPPTTAVTYSDRDGIYELALPFASGWLSAAMPADQRCETTLLPIPSDEEILHKDIRLEMGSAILGTTRRPSSVAPYVGVQIFRVSESGVAYPLPRWSGHSAADGTFAAACIESGIYEVAVAKGGPFAASVPPARVTVVESDNVAIDIPVVEASPRLAITGRVLDKESRPARFARLRFNDEDIIVSASGSFQFGSVAPGEYAIDVYRPSGQRACTLWDLRAGTKVDIQLPIHDLEGGRGQCRVVSR